MRPRRICGSMLVGLMVLTFVGELANADPCEQRNDLPPVGALEQTYREKLYPLVICQAPIDDRTACNRFLGKALESIFANSDFKLGPDDYFLANDIVNGLEGGVPGWTKLGDAASQATLDAANDRANQGDIVVAAKIGKKKADGSVGPGHVTLILPGQLDSHNFGHNAWKGLSTPNSATFRLDKPGHIYIGCPLSAAGWAAPQGVGIYAKHP